MSICVQTIANFAALDFIFENNTLFFIKIQGIM